jgi:hypothetical protein
MEKIYSEVKCYICPDADSVIKIDTDGAWFIKKEDFYNGKRIRQLHYYPGQIEERKFINYLYHGNIIDTWDDTDHELLCPVDHITEEEFENFGKTWRLSGHCDEREKIRISSRKKA